MQLSRRFGYILIVIFSFWLGMRCEKALTGWDEIGKPFYKKEHIYFQKLDTSLYIKSKTWGLTGNSSVAVLSLNKETEFDPDSLTEYIFVGGDLFFRQTSDSLIIYHSYLKSSPEQFNTPVKINLIEVNNAVYHSLSDSVSKGLHKYELY